MKIPFIGNGPKISANKSESGKVKDKSVDSNVKSENGIKSSSQSDSISISSGAELLGKVSDVAKAKPEVRTELVARLKKEISEGTYKVNSEKVADKMMKEALSEIV